MDDAEMKDLTQKIEIAYQKANHAEVINKRLTLAIIIVPVLITLFLTASDVIRAYFMFVANNYPSTSQTVTQSEIKQEIRKDD
jgi:hypothetical protein